MVTTPLGDESVVEAILVSSNTPTAQEADAEKYLSSAHELQNNREALVEQIHCNAQTNIASAKGLQVDPRNPKKLQQHIKVSVRIITIVGLIALPDHNSGILTI